jgi:uncharacterized protein (TIGR00252 family)
MTTDLGQKAEEQTARYLQKLKMRILDRNWRNRWCEIDIVAQDKAGVIHFVEVKYRRSTYFGNGLEAITVDKARRLRLAALNWIRENDHGGAYQIDVASVVGADIEYLYNAVEAE